MFKFNSQRFLEFLSSVSLSGIIAYLLLTKKYLSLVHPRHEWFLWFMVITLFTWSITSLLQIKMRTYKLEYKHCLNLMIPFLFLTMPLVTGTVYSQDQAMEHSEKTFGYQLEDIKGNGFIIEDKLVLLNSKNFYRSILQLTKRVDDFQEHEIIFTGYVSKHDNTLKGKDFTLSRVLMICCAADVAPYGLACHYEGSEDFKEGQWLTVHGIISKRNFYGQQHPLVIVKEVLPAKKIPGYVYP